MGGVVSRKTGERLDGGTGLNLRTVKKALAALKHYGVLVELQTYDVHTKRAARYALQLDLTRIDLAGLEERQEQLLRFSLTNRKSSLPLSQPMLQSTYAPTAP